MKSRKQSLSDAKRYRTCPPPEVADDLSQKDNLTQHLAVCPHCSDKDFDSLRFWEELVAQYKNLSNSTVPPINQDQILAGQIRLIKPEYSTWKDGLYYSPPYVMILNKPDNMSGGVQVAQIYHDISVAGPGDLILEEEQTGVFELFVECWNTYTLRSDYLGPPIAGVSDEIVEAVIKMEENENAVPRWAMLTMPMTEHDFRLYFRELEVEVGYLYASRAVSEIMADYEGLQLDYESVPALQDDIRNSAKVINFPRQIDSFEATLASARFPAEEYAKAAADDDRESLPANLVIMWDGKIKSFKPTQGFVTSKKRTETSFNISGAFPLIPDNAINPKLICIYWSTATGSMIPDDMHWDVETGSFYAKIHADLQDDEVIEFALVYESHEKDGE